MGKQHEASLMRLLGLSAKTFYSSAISGCALLSVASLLAFLAAGSSHGDIELLPSPHRVVGELRQHAQVDVDFSIVNNSSLPMFIRDIHVSCSCSSFEVDKDKILPGETGRLVVTLDSGSSRGTLRLLGLVYYQLGESGETEHAKFAVTAVIDPDIVVCPERLEFTRGDAVTTRYVTLRPRHVEHLKVTHVSATKRFFRATLLPQEGNSLVVRVDFDPDAYAEDAGDAQLIVALSGEQPGTLTIHLAVHSP